MAHANTRITRGVPDGSGEVLATNRFSSGLQAALP